MQLAQHLFHVAGHLADALDADHADPEGDGRNLVEQGQEQGDRQQKGKVEGPVWTEIDSVGRLFAHRGSFVELSYVGFRAAAVL